MRYFSILFVLILSSCALFESPYAATVNDYMLASKSIKLGMTIQEVDKILSPSQYRLSNSEIKQPDKYIKDNVSVDIIYYRSGWQSDGITTDDEFTPYIFNDNKLVAIGWQILGGIKSQGQSRDNIYIDNSTIVY